MKRNRKVQERYDPLSRFFHWSVAFLIGWQLLKFFDRIAEGEHWVGQTLVSWHVSIGMLLFILIAARIAWALKRMDERPAPDPATAFAVNSGHFLLYVGMALMPITGVLAMVGKGHGLAAFGIELVARRAEGDEIAWMASLGSMHSPIAWVLLVLVVGHIAMALHHHFIKRDGTIRRMA